MNAKLILQSLVLILFVMLFITGVEAKNKVVKTSGKKPDWVKNTVVTGYVIGMGSGVNTAESKEKAFSNVRKQITEAIAINVITKSESAILEKNVGDNSQVESEYKSVIKAQSGDIGLLNGISTSKIEGAYWELVKNKETGKSFYNYWIKYPFSESERKRLVNDFLIKDKETTNNLNKQLKLLENFTSIEEIESTVKALETMLPKFYGLRQSKAAVGIEKGKSLLKSVNFTKTASGKDHINFQLYVGNKLVTTSKVPKVSSKCIQVLEIRNQDDEVIVEFSDENCFEDNNYLDVAYKFYAVGVAKKRFSLNIHDFDIDLKLFGQITLLPDEGRIKILVNSTYKAPITIESLELNDDNAKFNLLVDNIDAEISGDGQHTLNINTEPFQVINNLNNLELNGYLKYQNFDGSVKKILRIYRRETRAIY